MEKENNIAFIDGQNLYLGTTKSEKSWVVDLNKFRVYLNKKYEVEKAYYFLGCVNEEFQDLYDEIQEAGFILKFREHNTAMLGKKKGNVDSDIIFNVMKKLYLKENFDKVVLISGDGDYKMLVDFLIGENKFKKILFPNKKFASSLYKKLGSEFFDWLENKSIKYKIMKTKRKGLLR
ncbi:NYN domain-containing protein [Patescibacteria group bacterium]|nr:NYN domain-containing protein [Patescibacteria group bacterium]